MDGITQTSETVCLTDSPSVVELKKEFRRLCQAEELLKPCPEFQRTLELVRQRKAQIGRLIFVAEQ